METQFNAEVAGLKYLDSVVKATNMSRLRYLTLILTVFNLILRCLVVQALYPMRQTSVALLGGKQAGVLACELQKPAVRLFSILLETR